MDDFKSFLNENKKQIKVQNAIDGHLDGFSNEVAKSKKLRPMKRIGQRTKKYEGKLNVITNNRDLDFLKYYFLVKTWASIRYKLRYDEIEFLMYFYSEPYFSNKDFDIYSKAILHVGKKINRFIDAGLIEILEGQETVVKRTNKCYRLTHKCKHMIKSIYRKLVLEESIDENPMNNPLFLNYSTSYKEKRVRELIKDMNSRRSKILNGELLNYLPDDIKKGEA
jgi:DNA-binding MarR family transcriptional regulator